MLYRGFPSKLFHKVPDWVETGALFHIRIALDRKAVQRPLTDELLARRLLQSARFYEEKQRWHVRIFLLMPDHLHAILAFAADQSMSRVIGDWKHFQSRAHRVIWQKGYFDHRLRGDELGEQLGAKLKYIRQNPLVAGLCSKPENWPWMLEAIRI